MNNIDISNNTLNMYKELMEEIKKRTEEIYSMLYHKTSTVYKGVALEFIALQVRKILELIIIANLIANKEHFIEVGKNMDHGWKIEKSVRFIKRLNENYYPCAIYREIKNGIIHWKEKNKDEILTENELINLYRFVSNLLHIKNPFRKQKIEVDATFHYLENVSNKIVALLNEHTLSLVNGCIINCLMAGKDPQHPELLPHVSVTFFVPDDSTTPSIPSPQD